MGNSALPDALRDANEALYRCREIARHEGHRFSTELRSMALRLDQMVDAVAPGAPLTTQCEPFSA